MVVRRVVAAAAAVLVLAGVGVAVAMVRDGSSTTAASAPLPPTQRATTPATPPAAVLNSPDPLVQPTPAPPPTTAGSLRERNLPVAALIGQRWQPYADPGGPESGFTGNGSWVRARDPRDVVDGLAPIGCIGLTTPPRVPQPTAALEGTYVTGTGDGRGVALALEYRRESDAAAFMTAQSQIVRSCAKPPGGVGPEDPLTLVITPRTVRSDLVVDVRREYGVDASTLTWTEVIVRTGPRIALLSVGTPAGERGPDPVDLAAALRASLATR